MDSTNPSPERLIRLLSVCVLAAGLGACGPDPNGAAPKERERPPGAATPAPPAAKRDLTSFDVCSRVPAADVAGIVGASAERTSGQATMGSYASDCTYTIELGDGMRDYVIVWLYPPELWAPAMDGDIETIDGLGDKAYLSRATAGGFDKVKILVAGDFMLEARAGSPDQARGLAELSLKRLTGSGG